MIPTSSFRTLFGHALKLQLRGFAHRTVLLLLGAVTLLSTLRGGRKVAEQMHWTALADARELAHWQAVPAEQWIEAGVRIGQWLHLPVLGSQPITQGVSGLQLSNYHARVGLAPAHRLDLTDALLTVTPELQRFGALDLGFVALVLAPLVALTFTFSAISGEKSQGTLRIIMTSGASHHTLLLSKLLAAWFAVTIPTALAALLGWAGARLLFGAPTPEIPRAIGAGMICGGYLLFHALLGLAASTFSRRPQSSLALALAAWVFFTYLVPRGSVLIAELIHPPPSSVAFEVEKRAVLAETRRAFMEENHLGLGGSWMAERALLASAALPQEQALQGAFDAKVRSSRRLAEHLSLLSPFGQAHSALMELAGTSPARFELFRDQADAHRRAFTFHFAHAIRTAAQDPHSVGAAARIKGGEVIQTAPQFHWLETPNPTLLYYVGIRLAFLLALAGALYGAASFALSRYDLR